MFTESTDTIAVVDSGIGGISVLRSLLKHGGNYIYFADNDFMPYGTKSAAELSQRLDYIISTLFDKYRVKKIFIACNTASSLLENKYPNVITMRFNPKHTYLATRLTKKNLPNYSIIADDNLASLIERHISDKKALDKIISKHIKRYKLNELESYVLGCTHYELVKDTFMKNCPNSRIYSNSDFVLQDLSIEQKSYTNVYFITTRQSSGYNKTLEELIKGV